MDDIRIIDATVEYAEEIAGSILAALGEETKKRCPEIGQRGS